MNQPVDKLLEMLARLEVEFAKEENKKFLTEDLFVVDDLYNNPDDSELCKLVNEVCCEANDVLITPKGGCMWDNHKLLGKEGFNVRAGEQDSFGWLTGIIRGKNFQIAYG